MFFNNDSTVIHRSMWGSAPDIGLQILDQVDALRSRSCGLGSAMSQLHNLHRVNSDRHSDLKDHGDRLLRTVVNANENFDAAIDYWKSRIAAIRAKIAAVKLYYQQKRLQIDRAQTTLLDTLPFHRPLYIPSSTHSKTPLDPFRPRLTSLPIPIPQRCRLTTGTSHPDPHGGNKASEPRPQRSPLPQIRLPRQTSGIAQPENAPRHLRIPQTAIAPPQRPASPAHYLPLRHPDFPHRFGHRPYAPIFPTYFIAIFELITKFAI